MSKPPDITKFTGAETVGLLVDNFSGAFLDGLLLMLALGYAHSTYASVPPLGYWPSLFLAWVLGSITASGTTSLHRRVRKIGQAAAARGWRAPNP